MSFWRSSQEEKPEYGVAMERVDDAIWSDEPCLAELRKNTIRTEGSESFTRRIGRLALVLLGRRTVKYWSPAIVGAAVASIALIAVLQIFAMRSEIKSLKVPNGFEARLKQLDDNRSGDDRLILRNQ